MHKKVKQAYEKAKFQVPANPADTNHEIFLRRTKRARPEDIKAVINQVWRTSQGPKKDFIFYERKIVIPDMAGNEENDTELIGKYEVPKFRNIYNNSTGEPESVALGGFETEYDIPYSPQKMREILTEAEIERDDGDIITVPADSSNTIFTLSIGGRKYGSFSAEDFIERSYDELVQLALYGQITNPTVQNIKVKDLRAGDDSEQKKRRLQDITEEEAIAYEEAAKKVEKLEEARKKQYEEYQKEQEEAAKKRQETVDQQSSKRIVRAEQTVSFEKEAPVTEQQQVQQTTKEEEVVIDESPKPSNNVRGRKAGLRPEREEIGEEVGFVLTRVEDQNVNEDEEIRKGFEELEGNNSNKNKKQQKGQ